MHFIHFVFCLASILSLTFAAPISRRHQELKSLDLSPSKHDIDAHASLYRRPLDYPTLGEGITAKYESDLPATLRLDVPPSEHSTQHTAPHKTAHRLVVRSKIGTKIKNFFKGVGQKIKGAAVNLFNNAMQRLSDPLPEADMLHKANQVLNHGS